jgi:dolichol-phosphate mannosyltransferase
MNSKLISIVVPTYNEELGIQEFYRRTKAVLLDLNPKFKHEIIFINDHSKDQTYEKLLQISKNDDCVKLINFSRNFGNQIGITAGLDYARGDIAVIIDDDLQDPPELIPKFIAKWEEGYKVVYGVRPKRKNINPFFKLATEIFYKLVSRLSDTSIPEYTGDFRLIDRKVIDTLKDMREENRYYRGMVAWVGFKQTGIEYERDPRYAGKSTFSPSKYLSFAINGLTSFTDRPLYFSTLLGTLITIISFGFLATLLMQKIFNPSFSIPGWTSLVAVMLFFGGVQLLSIGLVSVYISKIYREIKKRPLYIIEETVNLDQKS